MCVAARNRENFTKNLYFGVQGRSRLSLLVPPESSAAVHVMISSKSVSIFNRSHARGANSGKITDFLSGYPSLMLSLEWNLLTQWHQIWSQQTRGSKVSYGEKLESLSPGLGLVPACDEQTDGQTDRIMIAIGRLALRAVTGNGPR